LLCYVYISYFAVRGYKPLPALAVPDAPAEAKS
jgi:hypothetical protein